MQLRVCISYMESIRHSLLDEIPVQIRIDIEQVITRIPLHISIKI